jgi:DNA polymerase/3'-5' exonuclease PolX
MKLEHAQKIAQSLIEDLKSSCHRIEIGGSIRRNKPEVKDIELICIPVFDQFPTGQMSLEGDPITSFENLLFKRISANRDKYNITKMGEKYAQISVGTIKDGIKVDVFTATFRTWGYIFMLRTGPADFSKWVVTELKKEGFIPEGGEVSHHGTPCTIPSEDDLFFLLGMDYIKPEDRKVR